MKSQCIYAIAAIVIGAVTCHSADENTLTEAELVDGWQLLFDGTSTKGWRTYQKKVANKEWKVEDGALHLTGKGGGDLVTEAQFGDFELKLQWKILANGNSGIMVRVSEDGEKAWFSGVENQVLGSKAKGKGNTGPGAVYGLFAAPRGSTRKDGEWNDVRIVVKGSNYQFFFNGSEVADFDAGSKEWDTLVSKTKFKSKPKLAQNPSGHICLQDHGKKVWYRNIKLRKIKN